MVKIRYSFIMRELKVSVGLGKRVKSLEQNRSEVFETFAKICKFLPEVVIK